MNEMFNLMFSGFWIWLGFVVIMVIIVATVYSFYKEFLKYLNIRKHGFPKYCDYEDDEID